MAAKYLFEIPIFTKYCDIDWLTLKSLSINSFVKKCINDENGIFEVCFTKLKDTYNSRGYPTISIDIYNPYRNFDYIITFKGNHNQSLNRPVSFSLAEKVQTEYFSNGFLRIEVALFLYETMDPALRQRTRSHVHSTYGWVESYWEKISRFPYSMIVYSSNQTQEENSSHGSQQNQILIQEPPPAYSDLPDANLKEEKL